ncbi:hypothetical protein JXE04_02995 [Patescibacteria group bacterium]|nr:hypothetical protein [Patescibacteria group bacterium]
MKKKNIVTTSVLSLAMIALAAGFAFNAYAQTPDTNTAKAMFRGEGFRQNVNFTDEQKADMEARRAEMETIRAEHQAAMQTALNSGNYDTWVQVVKNQMGDNAPILSQVTSDNFSQFTEAHNLMIQAQEKFAAIGVDRGFGMHDGSGRGEGIGRGMGRGLGLNRTASTVNAQ